MTQQPPDPEAIKGFDSSVAERLLPALKELGTP
jgi:hypothetical protein